MAKNTKCISINIEIELLERLEIMASNNFRNRQQEIIRCITEVLNKEGVQAPIKEVPTQTTTTQEDTFGVSDIVENEGISSWLNEVNNNTLSFEELVERGMI